MTEKVSYDLAEMNLRQLYSLQKELAAYKQHEWFEAVLASQMGVRQNKLAEPLSQEVNATYVQEFEKGEIAGMRFALMLPKLLYEHVSEEIEDRKRRMTPEELAKDESRED